MKSDQAQLHNEVILTDKPMTPPEARCYVLGRRVEVENSKKFAVRMMIAGGGIVVLSVIGLDVAVRTGIINHETLEQIETALQASNIALGTSLTGIGITVAGFIKYLKENAKLLKIDAYLGPELRVIKGGGAK